MRACRGARTGACDDAAAAAVEQPAHVALTVTCEGRRDILGLCAGASNSGGEDAKYWLHVLTELKNRGVRAVTSPTCS
jgi:putative transposase